MSLVIGGTVDITAFILLEQKWPDDTTPREARKGWFYEMTNELTSAKSCAGAIKNCRRAVDSETREGLQSFDMVIRQTSNTILPSILVGRTEKLVAFLLPNSRFREKIFVNKLA